MQQQKKTKQPITKRIVAKVAELTKNVVPVSDKRKLRSEYIPFEAMDIYALKYRTSSTHRACITSKTKLCLGDGIMAANNKAKSKSERINTNGESLNEVLKKLYADFWVGANVWVEIVKSGNDVFLYHKDPTKVRLSNPKQGEKQVAVLYPNWGEIERKRQNSLPKEAVKIPLYPEFSKPEKGVQRSILHIKDYEIGFEDYGVPEWVGAYTSGWLDIDYLTGKYNYSRFQNDFRPSALVDLVAPGTSDEDKERLASDLIKNFTGEDNNAKVIVQVLDSIDESTRITLLNDLAEGSFTELQKLARENIITAHQYYASLAGIQTEGKLGSNQQIRTEFELAMKNTIGEVQRTILKRLETVLVNEKAVNPESLSIQTSLPVSFIPRGIAAEISGFKTLLDEKAISQEQYDTALINLLK